MTGGPKSRRSVRQNGKRCLMVWPGVEADVVRKTGSHFALPICGWKAATTGRTHGSGRLSEKRRREKRREEKRRDNPGRGWTLEEEYSDQAGICA